MFLVLQHVATGFFFTFNIDINSFQYFFIQNKIFENFQIWKHVLKV